MKKLSRSKLKAKSPVSWSLQLQNQDYNAEFREYMREGTRFRAKIVLTIKTLMAILTTIVTVKAAINGEQDPKVSNEAN